MPDKKQELELRSLELSQKIRALCEEYKADYSVVATIMLEDGSGAQKIELLDVSDEANKLITETLVAQIRDLSGGAAFVMTPYIHAMNKLNDLGERIADQQEDAVVLNQKHDSLIEQHEAQAKTIETQIKIEQQMKHDLQSLGERLNAANAALAAAEIEQQKLRSQAEELRQQLEDKHKPL